MATQIMIIINLFTLVINTAMLRDSLREGSSKNIVIQASLSVLAAWLLIYIYIPTHWGLIP